MAVTLAVVAGMLAWVRSPPEAPDAPPVAVEVAGDVPRPGWYAPAPATVHGAVRAAGGDPGGLADAPLADGLRVVIEGGAVRLEPAGRELVFALPLDINAASPQAFEALPGVGPTLARAIVDDRAARGPFAGVSDLTRVKGIGPRRLEGIAPFVTAAEGD